MKITLTIISSLLLLSQSLFGQLDSIYDQGVNRTYIVHLPTGYNVNNQYPIVLNLHGLGASATLQQSYSEFDNIADDKGFIVVYPNAYSNSWTTIGNTDIDFLSNLVDTIRSEFSSNNCLFVMGLSQGGFLTYKFANNTDLIVTAIAVGSGNMSNATQNASSDAPQIPIMHFHGTADESVPFNGTGSFIPPVDSTIQWWVRHNECNPYPTVTNMPNLNSTDSSTVERYYYNGGANGSEVTYYKILNGGHTWSGSDPFPSLGVTNQDINQSEIIGDFFEKYCSVTTSLNDNMMNNSFNVYPNPSNGSITVRGNSDLKGLNIYDTFGRVIYIKEIDTQSTRLNISIPGVYFIEVINRNGTKSIKRLVVQ